MFSGDHKKKKVVSLRGASKQVDRDDILKKAQEARQKRQEDRERVQAARTIQSAYRSANSRRQTRDALRAEFDSLLPALKASPDSPLLARALALLLLSAHPSNASDSARLEAMMKVLLRAQVPTQSDSAASAESLTHWAWRLFRFAKLIITFKRVSDDGLSFLEGTVSPLLYPGSVLSAVPSLAHTLAPALVRAGIFPVALDVMRECSHDTPRITRWVSLLLSLVCTPSQGSKDVVRAFAAEIFSQSPEEDLVIHRMVCALQTHPQLGTLLVALAPSLGVEYLRTSSLAKRAWLLANIINSVTETRLQAFAHDELMAFFVVVSQLLQSLPKTIFKPIREMDVDSEDEDEHTFGSRTEESLPESLMSIPGIAQRLYATPFVRACMQCLSSPTPETVHACMQYLSLLTSASVQPSQRHGLMSLLAFNPVFLAAQVAHVAPLVSRVRDSVRRTAKDVFAQGGPLLSVMDPLNLLAGTLNFFLLTVDDSEFGAEMVRLFPDAGSLPAFLAGLVDITVVLFLDLPAECLQACKGTRASVAQFLAGMHGRWTRLRYCAEDVWVSSTARSLLLQDGVQRSLDAVMFRSIAEEEAKGSSEKVDVMSAVGLVRLLLHVPFVVDFMARAQLFRTLVETDREYNGYDEFHALAGRFVRIRRDHLYQDAFDAFSAPGSGPALKGRVRVQMVSRHGMDEAGIDGGGLFREFLQDFIDTAFDPATGYFCTAMNNTLYPNPQVNLLDEDYLTHFTFMGRMIGKAIYEGMLLEVPFAGFFLSKVLGQKAVLTDLSTLDAQLHRNLLALRYAETDVEALDLDFTIADEAGGSGGAGLGSVQIRELIPGGKDIRVTNDNKISYIYHVADYRLNVQIRDQTAAFRRGLHDLIDPTWLKLFAPLEFQMLIGGATSSINVDDMQRHVAYGGGFTFEHPTIVLFWKVVKSFSPDQLSQLLKFTTGCSRPPLLGFRDMHPPMCIHCSGTAARLPTASTCMNLLKMPAFEDEETLRSKLLLAIESAEGFELS